MVLDELNKYAPREGSSPIKEVLVDVSERGRSLGIVLVGAQQTASEVEGRIVSNAALRVVGRLGVGLDNIDLAACAARGIEVMPATGANAESVAEYVLAMAMILLRGAAYLSTTAVAAGRVGSVGGG